MKLFHSIITAADTVFAPWITLAVVSLCTVFVLGAIFKALTVLWRIAVRIERGE